MNNVNKDLLKNLPKIDELLNEGIIKNEIEVGNRSLVVESLRKAIDYYRTGILNLKIVKSPEINEIIETALKILKKDAKMNLRPVINATGVLLHTNLGRALLSEKAAKAAYTIASSYSNLEFNITSGKRGSRYDSVSELIKKLTNAEDSVVVNNNAAAVLLILNTLAKDKKVIVSRGELVEIGGEFRVPDIIAQSGCLLQEVGTTNKTHIKDYEKEITEDAVLLKVHTSNYKIIGFTSEVLISELSTLSKKHDIPLIYDLGGGSLINLEKYGISGEPFVQKAIEDGADVVCFSGDKLLGGPQAGIIIGKKEYIEKIKKNPLTRAFRIDKLTLAALEATLREYLDEENAIKNIPLLNSLLLDKESLYKKAVILHSMLEPFNAEIIEEFGQIGGGTMPEFNIKTYAVAINPLNCSVNGLEEKLRNCEVPIITRVVKDRVLLDVLTLFEKDFEYIANCVRKCLNE